MLMLPCTKKIKKIKNKMISNNNWLLTCKRETNKAIVMTMKLSSTNDEKEKKGCKKRT